MPRSLEPGIKIPFVLESDRGKEKPPTFYIRSLTARECVPVSEMVDKLIAVGGLDKAEQIDEAEQTISKYLLGWKDLYDPSGKPIEFGNGTKLGDVCDKKELSQLLAAIYNGCYLELEDKKKLELPR